MEFNKIMLLNLVMNNFKINSENIYLNYLYNLLMILLLFCVDNHTFKFTFYKLFLNKTNENKLVFESIDDKSSERFRGLMYYISLNGINIKNFKEHEIRKWNKTEQDYESHTIVYKVNQTDIFNITKDIKGIVKISQREVTEYQKIVMKEVHTLEIFSDILPIYKLIDFVEECNILHKKYLKEKLINNQLFVDIHWNTKNNEIDINHGEWESSVTFNSLFFENKDEVIKKINFFLNNKEYYKKKGKPHTLGILLWGPPGTGKTGFIKSLANLTKKHIINIKLSKNFDLSNLNNLFFDEEIDEDLVIPLNNRIIVFEDIDCMSDIVKDRDINENKEISLDNNLMSAIGKVENYESIKELVLKQTNENNLSNLLNMLDGLKESTDRIIIMSTNKPEVLDKALIRSGRIDIKLNLNYASINDITNILKHYWDLDNLDLKIPILWNKILPHADIVNCCYNSNDLKETLVKIEELIGSKLT